MASSRSKGKTLTGTFVFLIGMTFVSVFTLILISVDRYWSVKWSVHYRQHHTKRKCILSIICVWLFMLVLWVPPWIMDRLRYSETGVCFFDPSLNKEFVFMVAILGHHGPYCIMIFCYTYVNFLMRKRTKISDSTRANSRPSDQTPTTNGGEVDINVSTVVQKSRILNVQPLRAFSIQQSNIMSADFSNSPIAVSYLRVPEASTSYESQFQRINESRLARDQKVFITLTYIVLGYAVLWLPFHIVFDISIINPNLVPEQVLNLAFWMAYFNSTINPVLYNFSSSEFRRSFTRIATRCKCSLMD